MRLKSAVEATPPAAARAPRVAGRAPPRACRAAGRARPPHRLLPAPAPLAGGGEISSCTSPSSLHASSDRNNDLAEGTKNTSCSVARPSMEMLHRRDPRHRIGRSATSRRPERLRSCSGLMWRLESRAVSATHTWAPVSAMAAVRCLTPPSATVTSTMGWQVTRLFVIVTEPETMLVGLPALGRFELLQHRLKCPRLRHPRQTASLAGQEALSGACVLPQFQQARVGCVLSAVAAAAASNSWSSSPRPAWCQPHDWFPATDSRPWRLGVPPRMSNTTPLTRQHSL